MENAGLESYSPERPRLVQKQDFQTAVVASALTEDDSVPSPNETRIHYTRQELLSLRPLVGDEPDPVTNTKVDEIQTLDPVNETSSIEPGLSLKQPDAGNCLPDPVDSNPSWGAAEIDEKHLEQANVITEADTEDNYGGNSFAEQVAEKKKKKKRSGKKKKPPPSGFEEFYADSPLTPQEYEEEQNEIYHHSRSFVERIQQCIQRYRARRKLDSTRALYFNKYLALGGVDTSMKAFNGGLDDDTLNTYDAKEIAEIQATDHIHSGAVNPKFYDAGAPEHWVVDFEGIAKGFLSCRAPACFGLEPNDVNEYCGVIRNFLNYVLTHSVCPEHTANILAAKMICDLAEKELPMVRAVSGSLPGDFNLAASTLYGGRFKELDTQNCWWPGEKAAECEGSPGYKRRISGITVSEAQRTFKTAIAFVGTYDHFTATMAEKCYMISETPRHFEVIGISLPSCETRIKFGSTKNEDGELHQIRALGVLQVKHWDIPDASPEDLTDDEEPSTQAEHAPPPTETFWLEEEILKKCWVGMKFGATIRELNIGIKFFDYISGVYPSFYTYLPAERLEEWKEPKLNPRGPPKVGDFDSGEEDVEAEGNDEEIEGRDLEAVENNH